MVHGPCCDPEGMHGNGKLVNASLKNLHAAAQKYVIRPEAVSAFKKTAFMRSYFSFGKFWPLLFLSVPETSNVAVFITFAQAGRI